MAKSIKVEITGKEIIIRAPLSETESSSGKSLVIASTRGNMQTDVKYKGKPVVVGLNVYVKKA